ncbi:hypothetical protein ACUODJ_55070, partial [Escherichia sp. HC-CC]
ENGCFLHRAEYGDRLAPAGHYRVGHLEPVQGRQKVEDGLGDLNKPLSNQNLITWKDTPVYNAPSAGSAPFGVLADNLRYPILHKLKDR